MRKRILLVTLLVSVLGLVLLTLLFSGMSYSRSAQAACGQLSVLMDMYAADHISAPLSDETAQALSAEMGGTRVTFLLADGTPVGDSEVPAAQLSSHAGREEVQAALRQGEGTAVRRSATLGKELVYYCRYFSQQGVLEGGGAAEGFLVRFSGEASSFFGVFTQALPTLIWLLLLDLLICLFVAWIATSFILQPVERLTQAAATAGNKPVRTEYPELMPIAKMMNEMNAEIGAQMAKMQEDHRMEKLVLNSMEHGIVIFRSEQDVLLINKPAMRLLDYEKNEPIACFTQDGEVASILAAGEPATVNRRLGEREYSLRFTFGDRANVLLITDVTELMAAARSKNDFIANVTHEMNTPLTSIKGFAELIAAGAVPPERIQGMAKTIIKQSDILAIVE